MGRLVFLSELVSPTSSSKAQSDKRGDTELSGLTMRRVENIIVRIRMRALATALVLGTATTTLLLIGVLVVCYSCSAAGPSLLLGPSMQPIFYNNTASACSCLLPMTQSSPFFFFPTTTSRHPNRSTSRRGSICLCRCTKYYVD